MAKSLKKIASFEPFKGITGHYECGGKELVISGSEAAKEGLRQYLTVENTSVSYRMKQIRTQLAKGRGNTLSLQEELDSLKDQEIRQYYADREDGRLSCPPGFWWMCEKVERDPSEVPYIPLPEEYGKSPRPYQVEACQALLAHRRASVSVATGLGKSLLTAMICHCMLAKSKRCLVVVPTIELVEQTTKTLKLYFGDKVGAIGGKNRLDAGKWIYVSTINSSTKVADVQDCVIVDEFHHSSCNSYESLMVLAARAEYCYGLTASPCRADGLVLGIHAFCGPIVYSRDAQWGIANGYLSPVSISFVHVTGVGLKNNFDVLPAYAYKHFCGRYKALEVMREVIEKSLKAGKKTLVLFKTEGAGELLAEHLTKHGTPTKVAYSAFRKPLNDFRNGESNLLLSNAPLLAEGVDIPMIDCIVDVTQAASESLTRQILGRGLRKSPGKERLIFISIVLHGYGHYVTQDDGESRWEDVYAGYGKYRERIYSEVCEPKHIVK